MNVVSVFSGIEGIGLALERAGATIVAQVEKNRFRRTVLEHHYPHVLRLTDAYDAGKQTLPEADLVCGGSPCQDLSTAGKRAGLAGEQSRLWYEFHRIVMELKPRWILFENVPGLLSSNDRKDFAIVLAGLTGVVPGIPAKGWRNAGFARGRSGFYSVAWRSLDAQYFDVPQRRARVFVVGYLGDGRAAEVLFERESGKGHIAPRQKTRENTASPLRAVPPSRRDGGSSPAPGEFVVHAPLVAGTLAGSGAGTMRPAGQANETDMLIAVNQSYGGWSITEFGVRRFTPLECERLQGFPDNWTNVGISDSARYRALGDSVAVPCVQWIAERIMAVTP